MTMTQIDVHANIRQHILDAYVYDVELEKQLTDDLPLIDHGILDSYAINEVLFFLEEEFEIEIKDEEVVPGNLGSINAMASFVRAKLASRQTLL